MPQSLEKEINLKLCVSYKRTRVSHRGRVFDKTAINLAGCDASALCLVHSHTADADATKL